MTDYIPILLIMIATATAILMANIFNVKVLGGRSYFESIRNRMAGEELAPQEEIANPNYQKLKITFDEDNKVVYYDPIGAVLQDIDTERFKFRDEFGKFHTLNETQHTATVELGHLKNFLSGNQPISVLISKGSPINHYKRLMKLKDVRNAKLLDKLEQNESTEEAFLTKEVEKVKKYKDIAGIFMGGGSPFNTHLNRRFGNIGTNQNQEGE